MSLGRAIAPFPSTPGGNLDPRGTSFATLKYLIKLEKGGNRMNWLAYIYTYICPKKWDSRDLEYFIQLKLCSFYYSEKETHRALLVTRNVVNTLRSSSPQIAAVVAAMVAAFFLWYATTCRINTVKWTSVPKADPDPKLGVTLGDRKRCHWISGVGFHRSHRSASLHVRNQPTNQPTKDQRMRAEGKLDNVKSNNITSNFLSILVRFWRKGNRF